jgi:hypothetical protein
MRKLDAFLEDHRGLHAAIGNEGAASKLRQPMPVLCHCETSPIAAPEMTAVDGHVLPLILLPN